MQSSDQIDRRLSFFDVTTPRRDVTSMVIEHLPGFKAKRVGFWNLQVFFDNFAIVTFTRSPTRGAIFALRKSVAMSTEPDFAFVT